MDATTERQTSAGPDAPAPVDEVAASAATTEAATVDPAVTTATAAHARIVGPAIATWLRHVVPLTLLSAIALSPLIAIALTARPPPNLAGAKSMLSLGWTLLAVAWICQLVLVGGASAMVRAPRSQLRGFGDGFVHLLRAVVPCLVAAGAVAIGCLALVVPGLLLLGLLALTGASRERGLSAPLLDSIAAVRSRWTAVALAVAALFAIDAAIGLVSYRALVPPLAKQPTPAQLASFRDFVRAIVLALVVLSPLPATVLATIRARTAR